MRNEYSVACFGYAYEPISLVFVDTVYSSTYIIQLPFAMTSIGSCLLLYFGRSSLISRHVVINRSSTYESKKDLRARARAAYCQEVPGILHIQYTPTCAKQTAKIVRYGTYT